jgi:SWI/SNF-related matrix-associated actin-dependent regulator 1 of chromatin subfamily A
VTKLRPFQEEGVRQIYNFGGRALLADEMGLGKTIQALQWIRKIPKRRPVIIITPASMKFTWQAEAAMHFGMRTEVIEGHRKGRRPLPSGDVIILNYDLLRSWLPALIRANPKCLIIDEVQFIKNLDARRTKCVLKLANDVPSVSSVVGLSGTPITNRPIEFWPVLQAIRPDLYPSFTKFAWRYCKPKYTPWGWQFNGSAHESELNRILLRECMIRRLKKDVLPELPDKVRRAVSFKLKSYLEYNEAEKNFLGWLKKQSPVRAKRAKKSQALTKVGYLLRLVAKLKLEWTTKWIEEFLEANPGEKLVGFTMHTFVIDHLKQKFGHRCVFVDGRVTGRMRAETVRQFQSNKRIDLFLGQWTAAGIGITLTAAHNFAAFDFPWTPGDLVQGEDRIHRIGQKKNCHIHYLAVLGTIEEKLIKILKKKSKILDAILNGGRRVGTLDIFDVLLREMKKNV